MFPAPAARGENGNLQEPAVKVAAKRARTSTSRKVDLLDHRNYKMAEEEDEDEVQRMALRYYESMGAAWDKPR